MGIYHLLTHMDGRGTVQRKYVYIVFVTVLCFTAALLWHPSAILGQERVEITAELGFDGEIKHGAWAPIRVTVTNNGTAVEGDVYVDFDSNPNMYNDEWTGTAEEHVELPQGATKTFTLYIPSDHLRGNEKLVFKAADEKVAEAKLNIRKVDMNTTTVGVLSTAPESGAFLSDIHSGGGNRKAHLYQLQPESIPEVSIALSGLDVLVLNNFPAETLNDNQVNTIKGWVSRGGTLIIGGGAEYQKTARVFQELSPVDVAGTTTITAIDTFQQQKEHGQELTLTSPLTVSEGTLKQGAAALVSQDGLPIVASIPWQEGEVIYTAYNLAASPLASWNGNALWWQNIVGGSAIGAYYGGFPWSLMQAANYIPSFELPSVGVMAVIFLVYTLLVGPVMYVVLRRFDKRGWAWVLIPLCAILLAAGVYAYGAGERGSNVMVHHVNVLKLHPNEYAELRGAAAVFVPKGGTYRLQLPESVYAWPGNAEYTASDDRTKSRVRVTPNGTQVTFEDVEFWSLRKAYVEGNVHIGAITGDLEMKDGHVVGTVTNDSELALEEAYVFAGGQTTSIGTLKPGESKEIDVKLGPISMQHYGYFRQILPSASHSMSTEDQRMQFMLEYLEYETNDFRSLHSQVQLVGWTEQPVYASEVGSADLEQYALSLITVPLDVKPGQDGKLVWPKGSIIPDVIASSGGMEIEFEGVYVSQANGSATYRFNLNNRVPVELEKLTVELRAPGVELAWLNWQTGEWEAANDDLSDESLNDFLSERGEVLVKLNVSEAGVDQFLPLPTLEAEGKVAQ